MVRLLMNLCVSVCGGLLIYGGAAQKIAQRALPETCKQFQLLVDGIQPVVHIDQQPAFSAKKLRSTFVGYNEADLQNILKLSEP